MKKKYTQEQILEELIRRKGLEKTVSDLVKKARQELAREVLYFLNHPPLDVIALCEKIIDDTI